MEQNPLQELRENIKYLWIHRSGNEAYAAISDTLEATYKPELRPQIVRKFKLTSESWEFHINLPAGLAYSDFKKKEHLFADALGGAAQIEKRGKLIKLRVSISEIKSTYKFSFEPNKFTEMFLPVHFGFSPIGEVVKDLTAMPNLIIAGHPGAGKSNFLHCLVMGLLLNSRVQSVPVILDFKRLEFSYLRDHVLLVTETDQARLVLTAINKELNKRLDTLERASAVKIQEYVGDNMPYLVLVIDELAEMQDEECQTLLNRILRLGRAAGVCVVCATQRPSSTMFKAFGDSKAMFAGTMCFHVRDEVNSRMILDNDRATLIPAIAGRGVYQWDDELEVQSMYLPVERAKKLLKGIGREKVQVIDIELTTKRLPPR